MTLALLSHKPAAMCVACRAARQADKLPSLFSEERKKKGRKEEQMKHFRRSLLAILSVCALFVLCTPGIPARAALPALKENSFSASFSATYKRVTISIPKVYDKYEVSWYNEKQEPLETRQCYTAAFFNVKLNRLYYYRVRGLRRDDQTKAYVPATEWSACKAVWTPKEDAVKAKLVKGNAATVVIKVPRISGVKSYTLYISAKSTSKGYRKAGTVKPGRTIKVSRAGRAALKYNKKYYYKVVPNLKKKATEVTSCIKGFRIAKISL